VARLQTVTRIEIHRSKMYFEEESTYHIYNRGNDKQRIFFQPKNYIFFLQKIKKYINPNCDMLAYCLMPTHFHFLIQANENTVRTIVKAGQERNTFSEGIRILLSTYTQAINKQERRKGSLFTQNTKAKMLNYSKGKVDYAFTCFQYIHQNPYRAGLVDKLEDWEYSSFRDYAGFRNGTLCNQKFAHEIINFDKDDFYGQSYAVMDEKKLKFIW